MGFSLVVRFLLLLAVILAINIIPGEGKAFGLLREPDVFQQIYDVASGKRDAKIKGNILNGDVQITTSYTNEEIMEMVAIGGGILLALVCCGVCFKYCCCPSKPTVIMYQQMPSAQPQLQVHQTTATMPSNNNMIPMRNQGFSEMRSQLTDTSPPPPYPGIAV